MAVLEHRRRSHALAGLLGTCLAVTAACTGGGDAGEATTTVVATTVRAATVPPPPADLSRGFVDLLAGVPGADPAAAMPLSDAARYVEHLRAATDLLGASGPAAVTAGAGTYTVCDPACSTYDGFVLDPGTGRVVTLSVDGLPLGGRIAGPGPAIDVDGVAARVATAYRTAATDLLVVVEVTNRTEVDVELFGFAAVFQPSGSGGGVEANGAFGDPAVRAGATGRQLLAFPAPDPSDPAAGPDPSGRVVLTGLRGDGLDVELDLTIPSAG